MGQPAGLEGARGESRAPNGETPTSRVDSSQARPLAPIARALTGRASRTRSLIRLLCCLFSPITKGPSQVPYDGVAGDR